MIAKVWERCDACVTSFRLRESVSRETLSLMFGEVSKRLPVLEKVVLAPPFLMLFPNFGRKKLNVNYRPFT